MYFFPNMSCSISFRNCIQFSVLQPYNTIVYNQLVTSYPSIYSKLNIRRFNKRKDGMHGVQCTIEQLFSMWQLPLCCWPTQYFDGLGWLRFTTVILYRHHQIFTTIVWKWLIHCYCTMFTKHCLEWFIHHENMDRNSGANLLLNNSFTEEQRKKHGVPT